MFNKILWLGVEEYLADKWQAWTLIRKHMDGSKNYKWWLPKDQTKQIEWDNREPQKNIVAKTKCEPYKDDECVFYPVFYDNNENAWMIEFRLEKNDVKYQVITYKIQEDGHCRLLYWILCASREEYRELKEWWMTYHWEAPEDFEWLEYVINLNILSISPAEYIWLIKKLCKSKKHV